MSERVKAGAARGAGGAGNLFRRIGAAVWKYRVGYLMAAPLMLGLFLFSFYPFVYGIVLSLFDKTDKTMTFVGFENFVRLFTADARFGDSCIVMAKILVPKILIGIFMPLVMAELIFAVKSARMQTAYRVLVLLPIVAPGVVGMLIWKQIYAYDGGVLNELLMSLGVLREAVDWLGDTRYVLFSIVFLGFPWCGGTNVLIYMSGLMNVSGEVIEASRLDGCGTLRRIFSIDMPLILGQIRYFLVFGIIGGLQDYSVQMVLTKGGPNVFDTYVPGYYMYKEAFTNNNFGYASAVGVTLFALIAVVTAFFYKLTSRNKGEY